MHYPRPLAAVFSRFSRFRVFLVDPMHLARSHVLCSKEPIGRRRVEQEKTCAAGCSKSIVLEHGSGTSVCLEGST